MALEYELYSDLKDNFDNKFKYKDTIIYPKTTVYPNGSKMWVFKSLMYSTSVSMTAPVYEKKMLTYWGFQKTELNFWINEFEVMHDRVKLGLLGLNKDASDETVDMELGRGEMSTLEWLEFTTVPYTPVPSVEGLRL